MFFNEEKQLLLHISPCFRMQQVISKDPKEHKPPLRFTFNLLSFGQSRTSSVSRELRLQIQKFFATNKSRCLRAFRCPIENGSSSVVVNLKSSLSSQTFSYEHPAR